MYIQSGIGNLGTLNFSDVAPRRRRNDGRSLGEGGSHLGEHQQESALELCFRGQPDDACHDPCRPRLRDRWRRENCRRLPPRAHGGRPEDYEVGNERVYRKGGGASMTLAQAAQRAIAMGGVYDGHELPTDINKMTVASAKNLAGQGLMGGGARQL